MDFFLLLLGEVLITVWMRMHLSTNVSRERFGSCVYVYTSSAPSRGLQQCVCATAEGRRSPRENRKSSRHCRRSESGFESASDGFALGHAEFIQKLPRFHSAVYVISWRSAGTVEALGNLSALGETLHCYLAPCSHTVSAVINIRWICNRLREHCGIFIRFITYLFPYRFFVLLYCNVRRH